MTDTKKAWGLEGLAVVRGATRLPLVAMGGIHSGNACQAFAPHSALTTARLLAPARSRSLCDEELHARKWSDD
ncbi:MAG: hypothetical protein A3E79_13360 [Burkholderiales bacterium RIFCSPHIGHO2_12_FULL_61_11]|nr:MAG: hypothetical protein A3E79_13360 [Burkholderiales bacterium RIFCSPHIGHO2_12_FULL_61_11]